jgi:Cap4 SAVED domain
MVQFNDWCSATDSSIGAHPLRILSGDPTRLGVGITATAAAVPSHYSAEERVAGILRRLGKSKAAKFVEDKLPTSKSIRSGDLGEILATEWIATQSSYQVPVKRLRWKDHRNMAMRGDDVIGIRLNPQTDRLLFLKTEAKSRVSLSANVVAEARAGLDKYGGLPSAHALSFIADRLADVGNDALSDAILDEQLRHGIQPKSVTHLLFIFSGNNPEAHLASSLQTYAGGIAQRSVGLQIKSHGAFVAAVFDQVIANGHR